MSSELHSIRWIAFDAVGTLVFADPPVHLAYWRIGQKHGSALTPSEVRTQFQDVYARLAGDGSSVLEAGEREFWRQVVAEVLPDVHDHDGCFEELFAHFADPASWQCFVDVEETLRELAERGFGLAIASNFDARLHRICDALPELTTIGRRVISSEVGRGKPDFAFYDAVLAACACETSELLMIGDDLERDVRAPRRSGIAALQLRRGATGDDDCLDSLTQLLDRLSASPGIE